MGICDGRRAKKGEDDKELDELSLRKHVCNVVDCDSWKGSGKFDGTK